MKRLAIAWVCLVAVAAATGLLLLSTDATTGIAQENAENWKTRVAVLLTPEEEEDEPSEEPTAEPTGDRADELPLEPILPQGGDPEDEPTEEPPAGDNEDLDTRLGGTRHSFETIFGEPFAEDDDLGSFYRVDGYSVVWILYDDDRAVVVNLGAPRDDDTPPDEADPADWSFDAAVAIALQFLPADAVEADDAFGVPGAESATCFSDALSPIFDDEVYASFGFESEPGSCGYALGLSSAEAVSLVTVGLGPADFQGRAVALADPTPSVDEPTPTNEAAGENENDVDCEALGFWAIDTIGRFDRAIEIATTLETFDPLVPDAADTMHGWYLEFLTMTSEQRDVAIPAGAEVANSLLVRAFHGYALAMEGATIAIATGDLEALDQAVARVEEANVDLTNGSDLLTPLLDDCGLSDRVDAVVRG